jgi:hypothetical protein
MGRGRAARSWLTLNGSNISLQPLADARWMAVTSRTIRMRTLAALTRNHPRKIERRAQMT